MTPHLHPRSRLTTSLFGTTLLVSFLVVGMPHIVPCPAPRVRFADSEFEVMEDGRKRRRRRQEAGTTEGDAAKMEGLSFAGPAISEEEEAMLRKTAHECPVPKPGGVIGQVLGFKNTETERISPDPGKGATKVEFRVRD